MSALDKTMMPFIGRWEQQQEYSRRKGKDQECRQVTRCLWQRHCLSHQSLSLCDLILFSVMKVRTDLDLLSMILCEFGLEGTSKKFNGPTAKRDALILLCVNGCGVFRLRCHQQQAPRRALPPTSRLRPPTSRKRIGAFIVRPGYA